MISRAACAPRICLACRLGLSQRSRSSGIRALPPRDGFRSRRFASGSGPQDKSMIEKIISGEISEDQAKRLFRKQELRDRRKAAKEDDLPDWGLNLTKKDDLPDSNPEPTKRDPETAEVEDAIDKALAEMGSTNRDLPSFETPASKVEDESEPSNNDAIPRPPEPSIDRSKLSVKNEESRSDIKTPSSEPDDLDTLFEIDEFAEPEIEILPPNKSKDGTEKSRFSYYKERKSGRRVFDHELFRDKSIGASALGKRVSALVIKNPNELRFSKGQVQQLDDVSPASFSLDWKSIQAASGDDAEDYVQYIDELRPKDARVLRIKEFQELVKNLVDGFMTTQLRDYLREGSPEEEVEDRDIHYPWMVKDIPWAPINTLPVENETQKESLARRIISEKWQLQIQDYVNDLGRMYVWLSPEHFSLVTQGAKPVLDGLRDEFLIDSSHERITTASSSHRLNIITRKVAAYAVLDRLDEALQRVRRRKVTVPSRFRFLADEIKELARITNTYITYTHTPHGTDFEVTWLSEPGESPANLPPEHRNEDPADIVFRLLTATPTTASSRLSQTILPFESGTGAGGQYVDYHRETKSMPWRARFQDWARLVQPVTRDSSLTPSPIRLAELSSLPEAHPLKGIPNEVVTTATFGHVLHPVLKSTTPSRNARLLCPVMPHPAALSAIAADDASAPSKTTSIILSFVPHVEHGNSRAPLIRLHLPVRPDANLAAYSAPQDAALHAVLPAVVCDTMLPAHSVDVRLATTRRVPLPLDTQPGLQHFLTVAEFNLLAGRIRTPSALSLRLPGQLLNHKGSEHEDIPYMFLGLEIHQTVAVPWRAHTLRYTSIEAGQHGGTRQELTLEAPSTDLAGAHRTAFLDLVEEVAIGKCFSWEEGFRAMKERLYEDYSYGLPEEELGEDFVVTEVEESLPEEVVSDELESEERGREAEEERVAMEREIDAIARLNLQDGPTRGAQLWPDDESSTDAPSQSSALEDTTSTTTDDTLDEETVGVPQGSVPGSKTEETSSEISTESKESQEEDHASVKEEEEEGEK